MFEQASKVKLRFTTEKGMLSTEDLWDLSLESLDKLARGYNKDLKEIQEESFISVKNRDTELLNLRFEIVKRVITVKLEDQEKRRVAAEKRVKKQRLLELIAQKEDQELSYKSLESLRRELEELELKYSLP